MLSLKTTWDNLDEMKRGIDSSKLPITIQDTLFLCRSLEIRYLWVDSLCILQETGPDEPYNTDWEGEAARFAEYYQNADITISATGAEDANEGLFLARPGSTLSTRPYNLTCRAEDESIFPITIYPATPTWMPEIEDSALGRRGWAVQERLLSTRTLHFASNAVF
ncbi:hypothetical protein BGZ60DRAFT_422858 [Tricladium varicosporioides]|nr:hypothetical protein BGZ60DRAFT_422858 [Hymenoscyphus varicosporioides]